MNIRHFQKINTNAELKSKICNMILISYNNDDRQIKRSNSCTIQKFAPTVKQLSNVLIGNCVSYLF